MKIRVRLPDGSRPFLNPVLSGNNKLKPLYAVVDGKPEHHPEGSYFLRHAGHEGKRVWEPVGNEPQLALVAQRKREKAIDAQAAGVQVVDDTPAAPVTKGTSIADAVAEYLAEVKEAKSKRTLLACTLTRNLFAGAVSRESLEEIDRKDVLAFIRAMRTAKQSPRTIANRISYLKTFLHHFDQKSPLLKTDKVKYTQKRVTAYSPEELRALFGAADPEENDLFQFFLWTGARDGEVQHATWPDLSFTRKTYTVTERLDLDFTPKDRGGLHSSA